MAGQNPLVAEITARDSTKGECLLWQDMDIGLTEFRDSSGLNLTGATTPIIVNSTNQNLVRWAAGVANPVTFTKRLPGDYNETQDKMHLRLKLLKSTPGDVGAKITVTVNLARAGLALGIALVTTPSGTISDSTSPSDLDIDCSSLALKGKDDLTFTLTPDAHATAVIDLFGGCLRYGGGLSLYNETDRYAT